ncbi:sodium-coupled neutral amino acid transporter 9 isoform X2 [Thalassophryne amazonica]|uniref:sodium-coupled neutral amino acid transporter 9 isoform X2 n=1 Tax=Thalassophryne amazonica TaxID=390379 RepID=UPI00147250BE|nr:sodium-coupled neutral amino acid transporter 9 isoform X2 [Thalassophryne amazonica]
MEEEAKPLLSFVSTEDSHSQGGSADSLDCLVKRPFHVERQNIVGDVAQAIVSDEAAVLNSRVHYYSRLTGSSDRLLSPPNHVIPGPEDLYIYSPLGTAFKVTDSEHSSKNPSLVTIFALWNTMMGTSILSMPWGIKQAGFTLGILILIFTGLLMLYCCYIVLKSPQAIPYEDTSEREFPDVCRYYFGKFGQCSSLFFSMVSLVGAMVVYWVLMSNFLYNTGQFIYNYAHNVSVSDSQFGTNGSDRGTISVVYLIVLVSIKTARLGFHLEFHWFHAPKSFVPEFRLLFPQLTGVLTLAFFIHNCVITLMKNNKHQENNVRDLSVAYLLVGLTYLYVGVLVFAAFPTPPLFKDCIQPNFLDNFPSTDVMVFVARACLLFQMVTVYPLLGYLVRVQVMGQIFGNPYPSFFHILALNIFVVGAGVLMATFYPNIGSIIRFSGATCGLALVFVFPALVHMISLKRQGALCWPSALFHSFLIMLGVVNLMAQFFM